MKKIPNKDIKVKPESYITDPGTLTVNTDTYVLSVHDGVTPGGIAINSSTSTIQGANHQIIANTSLGTTTLSIADNPIIPGSQSITIPSGTTAQRPVSPSNGMLRYNTETGLIEQYYGVTHLWETIRNSAESIEFPDITVYVSTTPSANPRQFTSVAAAISFITDASSTKTYTVYVEPGTYIEPQIVMKPFVNLLSRGGETVTTLMPSNPSQDFIIASNFSQLEGFTISGATGTNCRGVYFSSSVNGATGTFRINNCRLFNNYIDFHIHSTTFDTYVICSYLHFVTANNVTKTHMKIESDGTHPSRVLSSNLDVIYITGTNISEAYLVTGPLSEFNCEGLYCVALTSNSPSDGLACQNGGTINLTSGIISNFTKNIVSRNIGSAPTMYIYGDISKNPTSYSLSIEHPGTVGLFVGASDLTKTFINSSSNFVANYTDLANTGQVTIGDLYVGKTQDTLTNITPLISQTPATGVIEGGVISHGTGALQLNVTAGFGYLSYVVGSESAIKQVMWPDTVLNLDDNSANYVYVNNNNTIITSPAPLDPTLYVALGRARTSGGVIGFISQTPYNAQHTPTEIDTFIRKAIGPIYISGSMVTENTSTPFALDITPGTFFYSTEEFNLVGGTHATFGSFYNIGTSYTKTTGLTTVDHAHYNDQNVGLVSLTAGYYTKHVLYAGGQGANEAYNYVYGSAQYSTLLAAQNAPITSPPPFFLDDIVPIAAIIVQQGASNITTPIFDIRPRIGFQAPQATASNIHGNLQGLLADDHPQYLLASGARALLGDLNLNSHNITNLGTVNGVTVEAHASRHLPNGADPIATAAPTTSLTASSTNAAGIQNSLSRSDHSHQITGFQLADNDLTALSNISTTGLYSITGSGTSTTRTISGTSGNIIVSNGDGIAGNPVINLVSGVITTGTYNNITVDTFGRAVSGSNVAYLTGNQSITLSGDISGSGTTSISATLPTVNSNVGSFGSASSVGSFTVNSKGLVTAASSIPISITPTAAGLSNVVNSLQVINALGTPSISTDSLSNRPVPGTSGRLFIDITNLALQRDNGTSWVNIIPSFSGDFTTSAGNTVATLKNTGTAGTYKSVTTDAQGRVVSGTNPTTLVGFGITDAAPIASTYITVNSDSTLTNERSLSGTSNQIVLTDNGPNNTLSVGLASGIVSVGTYNNVTTDTYGRVVTGSNVAYLTGNQSITLSGDISGTGSTSISATLPTVNSNVGTFAAINVNGKGLAVSATNLSGDATTSGSTITLATINSNTGTFGDSSHVGTFTVNGKGLVTAASNTVISFPVTSVSGTANQITVSPTTGAAIVSITNNPVIPGTAAMTIPSGTTLQRPGAPTAANIRFNSSINRFEYYDGTNWRILAGGSLQNIQGTVAAGNTTTLIPIGNSAPTTAQGAQAFSQTITPFTTSSKVRIEFNTLIDAANNNRNVVVALFNGSTCIYSTIILIATSGAGSNLNLSYTDAPATTSAVTYSVRIGPATASTAFWASNSAGNTMGGTLISTYVLSELA